MKTVSKSTLLLIDPKVRPLTQSPEHTNKQAEFLSVINIDKGKVKQKTFATKGGRGNIVDDINGYDN